MQGFSDWVTEVSKLYLTSMMELEIVERFKELATANQQLQIDQNKFQSEKIRRLGQMIAGIAHEINGPIGFISANLPYTDAYAQDLISLINVYQKTYPNPTPEIEKLIEDIDLDFLVEDWLKQIKLMQLGANRVREVVGSMRQFSYLNESEMKTVYIHDGIESTLVILQHLLKVKEDHPKIKVIKKYGQLPLVTCYPSPLNQVFRNLLSNAIDALEGQPSPREIIVSTSVNNENNSSILMRIADNGCGISPEVQQKIFDPFFTTKPIGKGTGLGLSISYQIVVEKHGGQISCVSEPGKGTEFTIEIPVEVKSARGK